MKSQLALLVAAVCVAAVTPSEAQTLNWGGEFGDVLTDSEGNLLDATFTFELGAFVSGFVPSEHDVDQWIANWRMFDTADFNATDGYFTGEVFVLNDVTSSNPAASPGSFAGLVAYLWIRNDDLPIEGTEWLLVRSGGVDDAWTFPLVGGDCCSTEVIEWSISDLGSGDTPEWGRQNNVKGNGFYTPGSTGTTGLQTFTFVPEPSSSMLLMLSAAGALLVRRRRVVER